MEVGWLYFAGIFTTPVAVCTCIFTFCLAAVPVVLYHTHRSRVDDQIFMMSLSCLPTSLGLSVYDWVRCMFVTGVDCDIPVRLPGSLPYSLSSSSYSAQFTFTCRAPLFTRVGRSGINNNEVVTCGADGVWDFGDLRCEGVSYVGVDDFSTSMHCQVTRFIWAKMGSLGYSALGFLCLKKKLYVCVILSCPTCKCLGRSDRASSPACIVLLYYFLYP